AGLASGGARGLDEFCQLLARSVPADQHQLVEVRPSLPLVPAVLIVLFAGAHGRRDEQEPASALVRQTRFDVDSRQDSVLGADSQRGDEIVGPAGGCDLSAVGVWSQLGWQISARAGVLVYAIDRIPHDRANRHTGLVLVQDLGVGLGLLPARWKSIGQTTVRVSAFRLGQEYRDSALGQIPGRIEVSLNVFTHN